MGLGFELQGRYIDRIVRNNVLYRTMGGLGGQKKGLIVKNLKNLFSYFAIGKKSPIGFYKVPIQSPGAVRL